MAYFTERRVDIQTKLQKLFNGAERLFDERDMHLFLDFLEKQLDAARIFMYKHADYGPGNIADFGEAGVIVRMNDKMNRIKNLIGKDGDAQNESLADSLLDMANYAIIGILVLENKWPDVKHWKLTTEGGEKHGHSAKSH